MESVSYKQLTIVEDLLTQIRQAILDLFDINTDLVFDVIQNDLSPLLSATDYFLAHLYDIVPVDDKKGDK